MKIKTLDGLIDALKKSREGKKVVFTNGCFDLLHPGHVKYLQKAKALGDILVIGLNSDSSVKKIKGGGRPIMAQGDRATVLSALACVDYVVIFGEDVPLNLVSAIKPDVYVKGGDYTEADIPEAKVVRKYGGEVTIVEFFEGNSTTNIIKKVQTL